MADLMMINGTVLTLDASRRMIKDGAVVIEKERIVDVGKTPSLRIYTCVCPVLNLISGIVERTASSDREKDTEQVSINPCLGLNGDLCTLKVLLTQGLSGR